VSYDNWKTTAPEDDGPNYETPCPVCTGDRNALPCGEDCDRIVKKALAKRRIAGLYETAKRALHLAKMYRELMYPQKDTDRRIDECLQRVDECRADIKAWRDFVEGRDLEAA
jgi:hypothetical protein